MTVIEEGLGPTRELADATKVETLLNDDKEELITNRIHGRSFSQEETDW